MKKTILLLTLSVGIANGTITISGGGVANLGDEDGNLLSSNTMFALLVELAGNSANTFGDLIVNDTISIGNVVGDGKYFVLDVGLATDRGGSNNVAGQGSVSNFEIAGTALAGDVASGNNVAFVWFPELSGSQLNTNENYGVIRGNNWVLPVDGTSLGHENLLSGTKTAGFNAQLIPEPTSLALLGLGAFGLIARRRRV